MSWQLFWWKAKNCAKLNPLLWYFLALVRLSKPLKKLGLDKIHGCGLSDLRMLHVSNPDKVPDGVQCALLATGTSLKIGQGFKHLSPAMLQQQCRSLCRCAPMPLRKHGRNFNIYTGTTVPLWWTIIVDTDQILPATLKLIDKRGFGKYRVLALFGWPIYQIYL